jgi:hypothetical protein
VRWAYFLESSKPWHTTLCALFWRTVLLTPAKICCILGGVGLIGMGVVILGGIAIQYAWLLGETLLIAIPIAAVAWWLVRPQGHLDAPAKRMAEAIRQSVIVQGASAVKSKICPLIELK